MLSATRIKLRWALGGAALGMFFPLVGWLVAGGGHTASAIRQAHAAQPVLFIVDLAPLVLGVAGFGIGVFHARLAAIRVSIERAVETRTAELRHAMGDLEALMGEKDALLEDKGRFVATVSHELRTPLTSVVGLAHSLAEAEAEGNVDDDERGELFGLLVEESEEVAAIVEDLLVAARAEAGQFALSETAVRLDHEVVGVADAMSVDLQRCQVCPVTVAADPIRVRQVIRNLLSNARRYGGAAICVETGGDASWGVVTVSDDGAGVPSDLVESVFAPFTRAHERPDEIDPVGLGLSVSRKLARMMGGDLEYSRKDGWTRFALRLPMIAEDPTRGRVVEPEPLAHV